MKKLLTRFSFFVIILICFGTFTTFAADVFGDVTEDNDEIYFLKESGVVQGRSEGVYAPEEDVNRAEMLKILLESAGVDIDADMYKDCFPDVHSEWFAKYVCYAKDHDFISGYSDGYFKPSDNVNLVEALKMGFNVFGMELEDVEGEWYESFFSTARNYNIIDLDYNSDLIVSRELMAKIASKLAIVKGTSKQYDPIYLKSLRRWDNRIQDLFDKNKSEEIKNNFDASDDIIVKITSIKDDTFKLEYADENFNVSKGSSDLSKEPYIEIGSTGASFGLNTDFVFDGDIKFENSAVLRADADLSGFYGKSININWTAFKTLNISDKMGEKSMSINLESGAVSGDFELTKGITKLEKFPFELCVSDYKGYLGGITIINLNTITIGGCATEIKNHKTSIIKKVSSIKTPGVHKPILPIKPLAPGKTNEGGVLSDDELDEVKEEEFEPEYPPVVTETGDGGEEVAPAFPAPANHPGNYESPQYSSAGLEKAIERQKQANANSQETTEENKAILNQTISELEDLMNEYGIKIPENPPQFDPSKCCPSYKKDGKCCTGLDLNSKEGRAEYRKRINCLVSSFNEENSRLAELLRDAFTLIEDVEDWALAEANFAQLAAFMQLNKIMAHTVIDIVMGNVGDLKGIVSTALSNAFDDDVAGAFNGLVDPSSMPENFISSTATQLASDAIGFSDRVNNAANEVADKLGLTGARKDAFVNSVNDRFADNPAGLINPAEWLKLIYDSLVNEGGASAENIVNTIKKMRQKRDENLLEAWKSAQLLLQINAVLKKVRSEECSKACISGMKKELEKRKEAEKKHKKRLQEDSDAILEALEWILDYEMNGLLGDEFTQEEVKEKLLEQLKKKLCDLGYDLCWVDIEFEVSFTRLENGGIKWEIKNYRLKKRKTRKDPCSCDKNKEDSDKSNNNDEDSTNISSTTNSDTNSNTSTNSTTTNNSSSDLSDNSNSDSSSSTADNNSDPDNTDSQNCQERNMECNNCSEFIAEQYTGKVKFDTGRFIPTEYENCMFEIPEPLVHDKFIEHFQERAEDLFMQFIDPANQELEFNMNTGVFYMNGDVVEL